MRLIRIKAYVIDFVILIIALGIINVAIPNSDYSKQLKQDQNAIMEDYMSGRIDFSSYVDNYGVVYYQSALETQINYLIYFLFMIWYFVIIPFIWKGRTLGCYLCHVQVERFDQGMLHMWQLMVRYSFVFGLGYVLINNIGIAVLPSNYYFPVMSIVAIFQFVLAIFSAMTVLFKTEKRGLHELISDTELTKIIIDPKKNKKKIKKEI
jgi:RDD family.